MEQEIQEVRAALEQKESVEVYFGEAMERTKDQIG
jgi:hypothetical protein